jgi:hypothetical protein
MINQVAYAQPFSQSLKLFIPLYLNDVVTYYYTQTNGTAISEAVTMNLTITNLTLSQQLNTNYYQLFLFVVDGMNIPLNQNITQNQIKAFCNGTQLPIGFGYFKATQCLNNLSIVNSVNNVSIFQQQVVSLPIISTIKLNRSTFATVVL